MQHLKSQHQLLVESFMLRAKQEVPVTITRPEISVRILRAKLILEEALETIRHGLGIEVLYNGDQYLNLTEQTDLTFNAVRDFNLQQTIDGCCDLKVVTTGTLSACGVPDQPFQEAVDQNNLEKFGLGHYIREDGKLIKPAGHTPPNFSRIISSIM